MIERNGRYASAKIFTTNNPKTTIDDYALAQIQALLDNPVNEGCIFRIMPDVHPGVVGTIGLTQTVTEQIMPNVVGIDIGCGITLAKVHSKKLEFQKLDGVIRRQVPSGCAMRKTPHRLLEQYDCARLYCSPHINLTKTALCLGTLGGGNHFLELDQDPQGSSYIAIHSGSRHLGKEVTEYYLREGQKQLKTKGIAIPYPLTYLEGELKEQYLHDIALVQEYATLNRAAILDEIVRGMKLKAIEVTNTVHNYIEFFENQYYIRKGAISAKQGEAVVIPINMKDGIILGRGLGNADWNYSAPHGSGRLLKRSDVAKHYTLNRFKKEMNGIYSSSISKSTLDEAPFAYRGMNEIVEAIKDTVEITNILHPIYNFKAEKK